MDAFTGEIRMFSGRYVPEGWLPCDGSLQSVSTYNALFSLIGTTYGGDGVTTFGLPDFRGRIPVHIGQGAGLSAYALGAKSGQETVTLTEAQMPSHSHTMCATSEAATTDTPSNTVLLAATTAPTSFYVGPTGTGVLTERDMDGSALSYVGASAGSVLAHNNMMPTMALTFIICPNGLYPQRP